jgi:hypothetical protein
MTLTTSLLLLASLQLPVPASLRRCDSPVGLGSALSASWRFALPASWRRGGSLLGLASWRRGGSQEKPCTKDKTGVAWTHPFTDAQKKSKDSSRLLLIKPIAFGTDDAGGW